MNSFLAVGAAYRFQTGVNLCVSYLWFNGMQWLDFIHGTVFRQHLIKANDILLLKIDVEERKLQVFLKEEQQNQEILLAETCLFIFFLFKMMDKC